MWTSVPAPVAHVGFLHDGDEEVPVQDLQVRCLRNLWTDG
jgi:hypothetical protein